MCRAGSAGPRGGGAGSWLHQFLRYSASGVVALLVDVSVYWALTSPFRVEPLVANLFSRSLGGWTCFLLNKTWTFEQGLRRRFASQLGKFWVVFLVSLGLSEALLGLTVHLMGLPPVPAKLGVEGIIVLFNFTLLRSWAFRWSSAP